MKIRSIAVIGIVLAMLLLASCDRGDRPAETEHVHDYKAEVVAPTCTEQGYTVYTCTGCKDSYTDSFTPETGHTMGEWATQTPASVTSMGVKKRTCLHCDYCEEGTIPMLYNKDEGWTATDLFTPAVLDGDNARIPSIVTTKNGVTIAAIDKGHGSGDYGDISTVIRRSTDGGKTWSPYETLIDPPSGSEASVKKRFHSLVIDISMTYDAQVNRVVLLTSFYSESHANWTDTKLDYGTGWSYKGGENRLILRNHKLKVKDDLSTRTLSTEYYLGSDGIVYNVAGDPTEYTVPSMADGSLWRDGTLYKNGEKAGNIFLYTGDNAGELSIMCLPQLLVMWSDDDGQTWSDPFSINASVKPDKGEKYFGVGPGIGIQTESGRLVVPCWGSTGVCTIYSDDHGLTWKRGGYVSAPADFPAKYAMSESQVIELTDKDGNKILKLFGRSKWSPYIATSRDGGESWTGSYTETGLVNPDCQLSALALPFEVEGYEGKQLVLVSSPSEKGARTKGRLWLGVYDAQTDTFDFSKSVRYDSGDVWYSCLTVLPDNKIGLVYEKGIAQTKFAYFGIGLLM